MTEGAGGSQDRPRIIIAGFDRFLRSGYFQHVPRWGEVLIMSLLLGGIVAAMQLVFGESPLGFLLSMGAGMLVGLITQWQIIRWRDRSFDRLDPEIQAVVRAARRLPRPWRRLLGRSPRCDEFIEVVRRLDPEAIAVVGARSARHVEGIMPVGDLSDPTPLAEGGRPSWSTRSVVSLCIIALSLLGSLGFFAWFGGVATFIPCGIPLLLLGASVIRDIPWYVRWRRSTRRLSMRILVGPGFLVARGKAWTLEDSVLLLHDPPRIGWRVEATLVGPAGVERLRFQDHRDPDLATFWKAWAHPSPRVDLASGVLVSLSGAG